MFQGQITVVVHYAVETEFVYTSVVQHTYGAENVFFVLYVWIKLRKNAF